MCPELSSPVYGNVTVTGQSIGDIATYTCDSGFELDLTNGSEVRICQADGTWSGYPPACVRKHITYRMCDVYNDPIRATSVKNSNCGLSGELGSIGNGETGIHALCRDAQ